MRKNTVSILENPQSDRGDTDPHRGHGNKEQMIRLRGRVKDIASSVLGGRGQSSVSGLPHLRTRCVWGGVFPVSTPLFPRRFLFTLSPGLTHSTASR
jgi:hypothetical protein